MNIYAGAGESILREPRPRDGIALNSLITACPPLDENSVYCNLLQSTHFFATSVVAEEGDSLLGAITGYVVPERPDTLFIWQVAVCESARGQGLASRMLDHIVSRPVCDPITYLETTVTASNEASWSLFERFAENRDATLSRSEMFGRAEHFHNRHQSEILARIGPFQNLNQSGPTNGRLEAREKI